MPITKHEGKTSIGALVAAVILSGCVSAHNDSLTEALNSDHSGSAYVEGYVEYSGPNSRWAGPVTFGIHIDAREPGNAIIHYTPESYNPQDDRPQIKARTLASASMPQKGVAMDLARQNLAYLAVSMDQTSSSFAGCMYPVRARLVRADGAVKEKQGCRGTSGWPVFASEMVSNFIGAQSK